MQSSTTILESFRRDHAKDINLTLRPAYRDLLAKLGNPHKKLPPVFHVAGTNGKGSTCAFLRAMLEAAGYKLHVYTSPHLVRFHERIRIGGKLIGEDELARILSKCEKYSTPGEISYFEAATAAAFTAFAHHPADFTILEVGLGGRLDATNVIEKPVASVITRLSYDHRDYLGDTLALIAREKAGIMRPGVPCFTINQPDAESLKALRQAATEAGCDLHITHTDWQTQNLPSLALPGKHQYENAGLALSALSVVAPPISRDAIIRGLQTVEWPARLQKLEQGKLAHLVPPGWELWLDGGHNNSAGQVLAAWAQNTEPLHLIFGMLTTKNPQEFLQPLLPCIESIHTVTIPGEIQSFTAEALADAARQFGVKNVVAENSVRQAILNITKAFTQTKNRILICGSLYLAGEVLKWNAT